MTDGAKAAGGIVILTVIVFLIVQAVAPSREEVELKQAWLARTTTEIMTVKKLYTTHSARGSSEFRVVNTSGEYYPVWEALWAWLSEGQTYTVILNRDRDIVGVKGFGGN